LELSGEAPQVLKLLGDGVLAVLYVPSEDVSVAEKVAPAHILVGAAAIEGGGALEPHFDVDHSQGGLIQ
jgi:hypothetical protein